MIDYNPDWPNMFQQEAERWANILEELLVASHHIGSTSVPGLAAKPIIDIILEVTSLKVLEQKQREVKALGYNCKGENGIPGRLYFQRGGAERTHHVHAYLNRDSNIKRHLVFRDYLRNHIDIAKQYAELKRDAANLCNGEPEIYCQMKDSFVHKHERIALKQFEELASNGISSDTLR